MCLPARLGDESTYIRASFERSLCEYSLSPSLTFALFSSGKISSSLTLREKQSLV